MATIVGTVPGLQQCHQPLNIAHLLKKIKGFPPKVKSFPNTATYQKLLGEFFPPPLPRLYHYGGYEFACHPRGNFSKKLLGARPYNDNISYYM